jgi:hypothetical protein
MALNSWDTLYTYSLVPACNTEPCLAVYAVRQPTLLQHDLWKLRRKEGSLTSSSSNIQICPFRDILKYRFPLSVLRFFSKKGFVVDKIDKTLSVPLTRQTYINHNVFRYCNQCPELATYFDLLRSIYFRNTLFRHM